MDEKVRTQGQLAVGIACLSLSVPMAFLAAGVLLSYPDEIWSLGILCLISFCLLSISGVPKVNEVTRKDRENTHAIHTMQQMIATSVESQQSQHSDSLLASWAFTQAEWTAFDESRAKNQSC